MCLESNLKDADKAGKQASAASLLLYEEAEQTSVQNIAVDGDFDGHRLDYCVSRSLGVSRAFSQKLIKERQVALTPDRRIKPSLKVSAGDSITVTVPPAASLDLEPEDVDFEVVYSDEDVIVVNKPAGLVVHPAPGHWSHTLVHGLLYRFPDMGCMNGVQRPGIVHRLDATTSGLMVVARNGLAHENLSKDFKERRVQKEYLGLCWGTPKSRLGEIRYPIGRDRYNKLRMAVTEDGRDAWTDYETLWSAGGCSLLRCRLHTGRTHQIRVHMMAVGCPLVGDTVYAPSRQSPFADGRVFLHAWRLSFKHPRSGAVMSFRVPLPPELTRFLTTIAPKNRLPQ